MVPLALFSFYLHEHPYALQHVNVLSLCIAWSVMGIVAMMQQNILFAFINR